VAIQLFILLLKVQQMSPYVARLSEPVVVVLLVRLVIISCSDERNLLYCSCMLTVISQF
jgi:hypothetical protein